TAAWRATSFVPLGWPDPDTGRSRPWPTLDLTITSLPRYLLMVFSLACYSTITSDLPIILCFTFCSLRRGCTENRHFIGRPGGVVKPDRPGSGCRQARQRLLLLLNSRSL